MIGTRIEDTAVPTPDPIPGTHLYPLRKSCTRICHYDDVSSVLFVNHIIFLLHTMPDKIFFVPLPPPAVVDRHNKSIRSPHLYRNTPTRIYLDEKKKLLKRYENIVFSYFFSIPGRRLCNNKIRKYSRRAGGRVGKPERYGG